MSNFADIIDHFKTVKALVIGDPMIDHYHFGHVSKMSAEAPIPVFVQDREEERKGGAANVVENLRQLGCDVHTWFPSREKWSVKHRYLVGQHQMFRYDRDIIAQPISDSDYPRRSLIEQFDVIVLSDYGKGWLNHQMCRGVINTAIGAGIPVVVDPKGTDWGKYEGCTVICPNDKESHEQACGTKFNNVVAKKGERGMMVIQDQKFTMIPAMAKHVYDVTGAGDTVCAVIAAYLGTDRNNLVEAATLASYAAAYVVGEIGTVAINVRNLKEIAK